MPYANVVDKFGSSEALATEGSKEEVSFLPQKAKMTWIKASSSNKATQRDIFRDCS